MEVIYKARRLGKTTEVIKKAAETKAYIIVPNEQQKREVLRRAEEMKVNIRNPVTWAEFQQDQMRGSWVRNVVIDNADLILQQVFADLKIEAISLTEPTRQHQGGSK